MHIKKPVLVLIILVLVVFQSILVMDEISNNIYLPKNNWVIKSSSQSLAKPLDQSSKNPELIVGTELDKESICRTMINLHEKSIKERRDIAWNTLFHYFPLFSNVQNQETSQQNLLLQAQFLCPDYNKAKEIIHDGNV